ncbi:hypothetical protein AQUSIP_18900 [Aquicella siphonis]|uniref:DUF2232 domain-containing protein n=1 Tax=Aquicella siphonis TaxID=254247 RepID=A0A5E4PI28_9COXI|nr:hypothetical protein [Aquicella siphonis]VVC76574.1 hypothetical protein AQUSIP_18900 [Aquicella siphonis]
MRLQRLTEYLLRHRWQAIILTFIITYIPVIGMASILIACLVTLCVGVVEGAMFTLAATLPYVLVFASGTREAIPMVVWATVTLTVLGNVLTWVFAVMLRRHCSWSFILQVAALTGVLAISVIHLAYPGIGDWWAAQLQSFYNQSAALAGAAQGETLPAIGESQVDTINIIKNFATGILAVFVLFTAVIQVMVARWWQITVSHTGRLGRELQGIHLSRLAGGLFMLALVLYYLENSVVLDILPVLCLLFSAAGLSLVHYIFGLMEPSKGRFWLSLLYIALMYSLTMIAMLPLFSALNLILPVVIAVMILSASIFAFVVLGLFDVWFNMRKRIRKV